MHIKELWPSKYVKADDLEDRSVTVTIEQVKIEKMVNDDREVNKPVLYFREAEKALILNKTNGMIIAQLYGPETDKWVGKRITLYGKVIPYFGEPRNCIRVRVDLPDAKAF